MLRALLASLVCLLIFSAPLAATPLPEAIDTAYKNLRAAWNRKDVEAILDHYSTCACQVDGREEKMNRESLEKSIRKLLDGARSCEIQSRILSVEPEGDKIVVRTHQECTIDYGDRTAQRIFDRKDTWCQTPEGWKISLVNFITQTGTVDGVRRHRHKP